MYASATEDMDCLTFATPVLLRKMTFAKDAKAEIQVLDYAKAVAGLNITHAQFVDLCILLGCDYCDSIRGIGPVSGLKLIREHKSIEAVLKHLKDSKSKSEVPANWFEQKDEDEEEEKVKKEKVKKEEAKGEDVEVDTATDEAKADVEEQEKVTADNDAPVATTTTTTITTTTTASPKKEADAENKSFSSNSAVVVSTTKKEAGGSTSKTPEVTFRAGAPIYEGARKVRKCRAENAQLFVA